MVAYETAKVEEDKAKVAEAKAISEEKKMEVKEKEDKEKILKQKEAELEEAAKRLRKHRDADGSAHTKGQNGGVYRTGASTRAAAPLGLALVAVIATQFFA